MSITCSLAVALQLPYLLHTEIRQSVMRRYVRLQHITFDFSDRLPLVPLLLSSFDHYSAVESALTVLNCIWAAGYYTQTPCSRTLISAATTNRSQSWIIQLIVEIINIIRVVVSCSPVCIYTGDPLMMVVRRTTCLPWFNESVLSMRWWEIKAEYLRIKKVIFLIFTGIWV